MAKDKIRRMKKPPKGTFPHVLSEIAATIPEGGELGHGSAVVIACACANASPLNLPRTLDELGLDGISFQGCVYNAVRKAKCTIDIDDIPNSGDTMLIDVVNVIQNASKEAEA